jgi:hypothetical protein
MKFSILRDEEALPDLRLCSMHNPEKKDNTISAIAEGAILGFSASIFIAEKALQLHPIFRHDLIRLIGKDSELPHRADGKASLLLAFIERAILKKSLDVLPPKRLSGEQSSLLLALEIMPKARHKKIFLVSEFGVQPRLVHASGSFQFLEARVREPVLPEDRHRLFQHFLSTKALWAPHGLIIR